MKRFTMPLILVCTVAVIATGASLLSSGALAQGQKVRQQWEYANLVIGDQAEQVLWQAGKTTLGTVGDATKPQSGRGLDDLFHQMGGKEANPTLGMVLNLIGQDGWEMVSYARPPGVQTWVFKRSIQ